MRFSCIAVCMALMLCAIQSNAQNDSLRNALRTLRNSYQHVDTLGENPQLSGPGKVTVDADSAIVRLEKTSRKFKDIKGYRVQIFLGSVEQAKAERNKYLSLGLPYSVYLKQIVPEQALQVGDFISRMEMEKHLQTIQKYYPKAFGVVDLIEPPKFNASRK